MYSKCMRSWKVAYPDSGYDLTLENCWKKMVIHKSCHMLLSTECIIRNLYRKCILNA